MTAVTHRRDVSGHYAGPASRLLALAADVTGALFSFGLVSIVSLYLLDVVTPADLDLTSGGWVRLVLLAAWLLLWFWAPVALFGRTPAMGVVGLAVVRRDGTDVHSLQALARALVLPVSIALAVFAMIGLFVGRERRTLEDVVSDTVVVYDWGARRAEQPTTLHQFLDARVRRAAAEPAPDA